MSEKNIEFNLEIQHPEYVTDDWYQYVMLVVADPRATVRERILATALSQLGKKFNQLAQSLETGSVVVSVKEDDIRFGNLKHPPGRPNRD